MHKKRERRRKGGGKIPICERETFFPFLFFLPLWWRHKKNSFHIFLEISPVDSPQRQPVQSITPHTASERREREKERE